MKVSELAFKRILKCELCGCEFVINNKLSRTKRCPECAVVQKEINRKVFAISNYLNREKGACPIWTH